MRHVRIVTALLLVAPTSAQTLLRSVPGPGLNAQFGAASILVPDQNADGYADVLVGAPGYNQERGAIFCVSGGFLATGLGASTVWSLAPTANQGDRFGASLAFVGDATGDGIGDFLVGQPGYDTSTFADAGRVHLIDGVLRQSVRTFSGPEQGAALGTAMTVTEDATGDGRVEVAVSAPGALATTGRILVFDLSYPFGPSGTYFIDILWGTSLPSALDPGVALASGFDFNGDTVLDIAVGIPGGSNGGGVRILSGFGLQPLGEYLSVAPGERLGAAVDAAHDYDGDGRIDLVIGAPNAASGGAQPGRAVVVSSKRLYDDTPPFEIYTLSPLAPGATPTTLHFGAAVRASADLNGDGVGDFLVGAPDFSTTVPIGPGKGAVTLYSGATGQRLSSVVGANQDRLGDSILGAVADLDGDSFPEFVVAGSRSDVVAVDNGVLKAYRLFPVTPSTYCTGKPNSLGCTPSIGFTGSPSASAPSGFVITATNVLNQKNGLCFYSYAPQSAAFQGGFLCVATPTLRTPPQSSGGATSGASCTGAFDLDFNAWIASGFDASLVVGAEVYAQYWARDPQSPSKTSLSNALRLLVNP